MSKTPLTVMGAELLRAELQRLRTVDRHNVIAAIAEARSHGDLSENAEYDAAKERQSFIEGRIAEVESKLANAQVIDPKLLDADGRCVFGATVDLQEQANGDKVTYQIVGDDEADIKHGKISIGSPIARALIGKYAGDVVEVQAPGGVREFEIIDVRYEYNADTGLGLKGRGADCRHISRKTLRAARANRVFCADEKHIRTENTVMVNPEHRAGFIQDRRLRADVLFIRVQSTIRADGFSSAQDRNSATAARRCNLPRIPFAAQVF
jgi:transcription elongation factor GreA